MNKEEQPWIGAEQWTLSVWYVFYTVAYISQHMCGNIEGDRKGEQENMGNCEREMDNKELMEKLEKMDKKLNAIGNALLIFISVNGARDAKEMQKRQEKEGDYSGIYDDLRDQTALINVCDDLKKAMEEKKNTVDEDILDDLVDRLIKTFFS